MQREPWQQLEQRRGCAGTRMQRVQNIFAQPASCASFVVLSFVARTMSSSGGARVQHKELFSGVITRSPNGLSGSSLTSERRCALQKEVMRGRAERFTRSGEVVKGDLDLFGGSLATYYQTHSRRDILLCSKCARSCFFTDRRPMTGRHSTALPVLP
eukprot:5389681-Pleurochrysis_carterae.AAC.2